MSRTLALIPALCIAAAAFAQPTRVTVTVDKPADLPRVAAELVVDSKARAAVVSSIVDGKMSPDVIRQRTEETRAAFEPVDSLLSSFTVVSHEELGPTAVRVVCDADVALGAVFLRLIRAKVLTFAGWPPKILLLPSSAEDLPALKILRAHLETELSGTGVRFLDNEDATPGFVAKRGTPQGRTAISAQAQKVAADYVAVVTITRQRAPSPVGGYVIDENLQYTILRPHSLAILAEKAFTARGSGATALLAEEDLMRQQSPKFARALSGDFVTTLFSDVDVVDPMTARPEAAASANTTAPASQKTAANTRRSTQSSTTAPAATPTVALASSSDGAGSRPPLILRRKIQ